jgi:hypothetical protein
MSRGDPQFMQCECGRIGCDRDHSGVTAMALRAQDAFEAIECGGCDCGHTQATHKDADTFCLDLDCECRKFTPLDSCDLGHQCANHADFMGARA